jgi:O-antigen ligase
VSLAWGAFAFGAVYPWAFTPLLVACLAVGLASFALDANRRVNWRVAASILAIGAAGGLQLVPLASGALKWISPATDHLLRQYDVGYANAVSAPHALSIDPQSTWRGLAFLACFGVLLVGLARILTRREVGRLAAHITVLGTVVALVAIVQRATFAGKIYGFWQPLMASTPFGPFVNRNHFAGWMLMALPLAVGLFCGLVARGMRDVSGGSRGPQRGSRAGVLSRGPQRGSRAEVRWRSRLLSFSSPDASRVVLVAFASVAMGVSLVLSRSRLGLCGLATALVLAGWFVMRNQMARTRRAVAGGYLLLLVVGGGATLWAGLDEVVARFADPGAHDLGGRLPIWAETVRITRDFPLSGTGLNTYGTATLFYETTGRSEHLREAHSEYLQLAAEGGLLLGIPIVVAIVIFAREVYQRFRDASDEITVFWIRTGAVTGLVAIALQSVGEFSLQMPGNAALFTVLCAIAIHKSRRQP